MRHFTDGARLRSATALVPAAVAGSMALILAAAPAAGATERSTGSHPLLRSPVLLVPAVAAPATYTVQRGDTVYGIAARFGLRTADVLALNGLTASSIIRPGQVLRLIGAAAPAPAPAPPAASVSTAAPYTVQKGDTLSSIASRHGISVQSLFAANGLGWGSIIHPGQKLRLSAGQPGAAPAAPAAPAAQPPAAASGKYTIQKGDTLSSIASRHGVTVQTLFAANGLGWGSIVYPGQTIALAVAPPPAPATAAKAPLVPHPLTALDAEQKANARLIIRVGRALGVADRGLAIALGAAMQESGLRNVAHGDRDSLGLFQQRPSAGWGTVAEVSDPDRAARAFFGGPSDPNGSRTRGLLDIRGWQNLSFGDAAQAVQISASPELYGLWEPAAVAWLASLG